MSPPGLLHTMSDIYLDNAATSWPKPEETYRRIEHFMRSGGGTPSRGKHPKAVEAGRLLSECRARLCRLLGAENGYDLVFSSGATESLNLALKGWVRPGGHVVVTELEHNSIFRPLSALHREKGVTWSIVPAGSDGQIDPAQLAREIQRDTCLVAVTHASNVVGVKVDVEQIAELAHRKGVPVLVDAAQTVGVCELDLQASKIDLVAFTGHKSLLGAPGTGGLLIREGIRLNPLKEGGTGTYSELEEQPEQLPDRFESGSPNMYGLAGLLGGIGYLERVGPRTVGAKKRQLADLLRRELRKIPGVSVYGCPDPSKATGIVAFNVGSRPSEQVAGELWERARIMVRAGLHCAPRVHKRLGTESQGVVRVGLGFLTEPQDLHALVVAVHELS